MIQMRKYFHKCFNPFHNYLKSMAEILLKAHFLLPFFSSLLIMMFVSIPRAPEQTFWFNFSYAAAIYTLINLLGFFLLRTRRILSALSHLFEMLAQGRVLMSLVLIVLYTKLLEPQNAAITDALVLGLIVCFFITACRDAVHFSRFIHQPQRSSKK